MSFFHNVPVIFPAYTSCIDESWEWSWEALRVLVVEDSNRLRTYLGKGLRAAGYAVDLAADGEEGLWFADSTEYDVIVLDLMLPKVDGLTVLRKIREAGRETHVLILTARDSIEDRVDGLQRGADDYLIKPFAFAELLARVQTLVRRSFGVKSPQIMIGPLKIDTARREASLAGELLNLPPREYALLEYLALKHGEIVTRTEIEQHIYDERAEPMSNVVDSAICNLRRKIDPPEGPSLIQTRRGMGYVLEVPTS